MRKEILFFVLIALIAVASADVQITSYSVLPTTLKPGVTGSASITVYNPSSSTVTGVIIYQGGEQFTFTTNRVQVGDLGTLGSTVITIPFTIKSDVSPGVYNLRLDAFWSEGTGTRTKTFSIPISVTNPPIFRFSFTPLNQITPGGSFTIDGQIKNEGGSVSKMVLTVNSSYFFFDRMSQISLGDLETGQNLSFELPMVASASLQPGVQSLPLIITYQDPLGAIQQATIAINPVEVMKSSVDFTVDAQPEKKPVSPGDKMKLFVNLTNTGNSKAYSAKITVSSSSAYFTSLGSSERYFELISSDSKKQVEFEIGVSGNTPAGYYPLTITVNYLNVNGEVQTPLQKQVGLEVGGSPQISITPDTSPFPISAGGKYALSLQFSNTGTINIRALTVSVSGENFEILSSAENYIGSLNLDEYTTVQYTIHAKNNLQPAKYPIHVSMNFKDSYNNQHSIQQDVLLEIVSPDVAALTQKPDGLSLTSILIIIVVIGVIGYFVYKRYFKKKAK
jgi:hypothetical protein